MIKPGYLRWKIAQQTRAIAATVDDVDASAVAAAAAAATAQADATTALADASTGIADAAAAQSDVDELEVVVNTVQAGAEAQTEALAAAAGQVNAPTPFPAGSPLIIGFYTTTGSATIYYKVNGSGGWTTYTTPVTLTPGDYIEAYATAAGLTDSGITRYDT